jgi:hypothetical protein
MMMRKFNHTATVNQLRTKLQKAGQLEKLFALMLLSSWNKRFATAARMTASNPEPRDRSRQRASKLRTKALRQVRELKAQEHRSEQF